MRQAVKENDINISGGTVNSPVTDSSGQNNSRLCGNGGKGDGGILGGGGTGGAANCGKLLDLLVADRVRCDAHGMCFLI